MATLFFSYSHVDESLRDLLETHLSGLRRQGLVESWHDRRITAGEEFGPAIDAQIDTDDVILLLVSPDFIASDYCYQREMTRALARHQRGDARVLPVILRPCDWHDLPFGKILATPKDGLPVTKWPNIDDAFLDVVVAIKRALKELGQKGERAVPRISETAEPASLEPIRSSNLRIKKQFTIWTRISFVTKASNTSPSFSRIHSKNSLVEIPPCSRIFGELTLTGSPRPLTVTGRRFVEDPPYSAETPSFFLALRFDRDRSLSRLTSLS